MSHTASRKGGYGKSPERKADGRVTRRQDDRRAEREALDATDWSEVELVDESMVDLGGGMIVPLRELLDDE